MPFGSFNKKIQESNDNRVGASDNAIVLQGGSFLFNPGRKNENPVLGETSAPNWPVIVTIAAVVIVVVVWFNSRK